MAKKAAAKSKAAAPKAKPAPKPVLSHLDSRGQAHMVDVSAKSQTERVAKAEGKVIMRKETLDLVIEGNALKGDVLGAARLAGIAVQLLGSLGDLGQGLHEFLAVGQGQGLQQRAFGAVGGVARGAQGLAAGSADRHGIGALVFFGALAAEQALLQHPAHHFGQRRTVNAGDLNQGGLAGAVILLQRAQQRELLLGQFLAAGFARIQVAIELLAAADQVRGRFGKVKAIPRTAPPLDHAMPLDVRVALAPACWPLMGS